jgi:hypothetical protein
MFAHALFTLSLVALPAVSLAQPAIAPPESVAFEILFKEIRAVDQHITILGNKATVSDLPRRYRNLFSISESDDQALKRTAGLCLAETEALDKRASDIIAGVKARYRPTGGPGAMRAEKVPPPPPELAALQLQKGVAISKHLLALERDLGRGTMAILSSEVRRHVGAHITTRELK